MQHFNAAFEVIPKLCGIGQFCLSHGSSTIGNPALNVDPITRTVCFDSRAFPPPPFRAAGRLGAPAT
jgi:hypothetical protein